ncbi:MAG: hypothetical protein IIA30_00575 [Myxococcales bacterium]|nr:hypothetical protein [Myxococcales bacterium]
MATGAIGAAGLGAAVRRAGAFLRALTDFRPVACLERFAARPGLRRPLFLRVAFFRVLRTRVFRVVFLRRAGCFLVAFRRVFRAVFFFFLAAFFFPVFLRAAFFLAVFFLAAVLRRAVFFFTAFFFRTPMLSLPPRMLRLAGILGIV